MAVASGLTDLWEGRILSMNFAQGTSPTPATWYVGVVTAPPADDSGTATTYEPVGGSYVRMPITFEAQGAYLVQLAPVTFPEATGLWGDITGFVIYDSSAGVQHLMYGEIVGDPRTVDVGDTVNFDIGMISAWLAPTYTP